MVFFVFKPFLSIEFRHEGQVVVFFFR